MASIRPLRGEGRGAWPLLPSPSGWLSSSVFHVWSMGMPDRRPRLVPGAGSKGLGTRKITQKVSQVTPKGHREPCLSFWIYPLAGDFPRSP